MPKLNINKLIANDIVNYGMDNTSGFNYTVDVKEFLKDYEDDSRKYITNNINEIIMDIGNNENVADIEYDESLKEISMVFYYDNLITPLERKIVEFGRITNKDYDLDEIRHLSFEIEQSKKYNNLILESINRNKYLGIEI